MPHPSPTCQYEQAMQEAGLSPVAGLDEVGRGPLAGPVVAAAVILGETTPLEGLNDSKVLSPKKRETLFPLIHGTALGVGIGIVSPQLIDTLNIGNATRLAMQRAVQALPFPPAALLIDGRERIPALSLPQLAIVRGDQKSCSIAAASIVAKVTRDRIMHHFDITYPQYGFAKHVGYGTRAHQAAIKQFGPSLIHRHSFLGFTQRAREAIGQMEIPLA